LFYLAHPAPLPDHYWFLHQELLHMIHGLHFTYRPFDLLRSPWSRRLNGTPRPDIKPFAPSIHALPQVLVAFLVILGLLFGGMQVPDLSRPHRPKATHRVVLKTQYKTASSFLKQQNESVTVFSSTPAWRDNVAYRAVSHAAPPLYASPLTSPNAGRSPPANC